MLNVILLPDRRFEFFYHTGISVVLALTGIFGVMVSTVSQRTNEIGIRVALGATTADVLKLVMGQGLKLIVIGLALGLGIALAATPAIGIVLVGRKGK